MTPLDRAMIRLAGCQRAIDHLRYETFPTPKGPRFYTDGGANLTLDRWKDHREDLIDDVIATWKGQEHE